MAWTRRRMLIWGKTYPELSNKYTETVCTGAVLLDEPKLIRIYPLDYRYQPEERRPKKWSIISADIEKSSKDHRSESYRIQAGSIEIERVLGTEDGWAERLKYMLRPEFTVTGMDDMHARQAATRQSLGVLRDFAVERVYLERVSDADYREQREKYSMVETQNSLFEPGRKPMPPLKYRPRVSFRAVGDDKSFDRLILDWETCQAVAHSLEGKTLQFGEHAFQKHMMERAFSPEHAPSLVLGNIASHPHVFVVVCILYPKKVKQKTLF